MTAYRRAHLLVNTLGSIARQKVPDLEVIVVEDGDDGGRTREICEQAGVVYVQRKSRPNVGYSNQARVINLGLRRATGEITILQNAECQHVGDVIESLCSRVGDSNVVFAKAASLQRDGSFLMWYVHPDGMRRPFFFCGAMRTANFIRLGGFEESFTSYGYEDDDFAERLGLAGIRFDFTYDMVEHQWHEQLYAGDMAESRKHLELLRRTRPGCVANVGREWGVTV